MKLTFKDILLWGAAGYVGYRLLKGGAGSVANIVDDASFAVEMWKAVGAAMPGASTITKLYVVAQAAHETEWGTYSKFPLTNNAFNITAGSRWAGPTLDGPDKDGNNNPIIQHWRVYGSLSESVTDFLALLQNGYPDAYAQLMAGDPAYIYSLKNGLYGSYYAEGADAYAATVTGYVDDVKLALGLA